MAAGVKNFILISTDKAVRTTSIMGASKRLAEMVLQALQEESSATRFSMVRFGNVLGSSGSVVPLFLEQIQHGGPVTVTHADVTRYFMTISEAAALVLQAASMSRGGDLFLLDMGEPVKILELARRMIHLKGTRCKDDKHPDGDIAIEIIGLKRGEKLHEELLLGEAVAGTEHRKILRAEERFVPGPSCARAATLEAACDDFDYDAIKAFIEGLVEGADLAEQLGGLYRRADIIALKPAGEEKVLR
jgi:FlaA1/EpsC-like NDP-sugar epimerase